MTRFAAAAWPDLAGAAGRGAVLLVPVGATEQHGPHLPVTTDTDLAVSVAEGAAASDGALVAAPALAFGSSGEHQGFAGTLSIGQAATERVLVELCRSATVDFEAVVLVSTHGGNVEPVARAVGRLVAEGRAVTPWSPSWDGDLHAGRTETSLMLAVAPGRVALDRAAPGAWGTAGDLLPLLRRHGVRSVSANGVLGDPRGASVEEGRRLLASAVAELVAVGRRLARAGSGPPADRTSDDDDPLGAAPDGGAPRRPREVG